MRWQRCNDTVPQTQRFGPGAVVPWFARITPWGRNSWSVMVTNGQVTLQPGSFVIGSRQRAQRAAERMVRRQVATDARPTRRIAPAP